MIATIVNADATRASVVVLGRPCRSEPPACAVCVNVSWQRNRLDGGSRQHRCGQKLIDRRGAPRSHRFHREPALDRLAGKSRVDARSI
jgi:hypothetical protein